MAPEIAWQLKIKPVKYYFDGFCGGMAVLFAMDPPASNETVVDLHGDLTNLAWTLQVENMAVELYARLVRTLYDQSLFKRTRDWLDAWHKAHEKWGNKPFTEEPDPEWAYHYFIASWMGRNGVSGTERVNYQMAMRWTAKGGSGPIRFRAAVESIPDWHQRLRNVCILRKDTFTLIPKLEDEPGLAMYMDPPYLIDTRNVDAGFGRRDGGSLYVHDFHGSTVPHPDDPEKKIDRHELLALQLRRFKKARIVVSYYDHPRLLELYPGWSKLDCSRHKHLHVQNKRGSERQEAPEVLLINGPIRPPKGTGGLFA